MLIPHTTDASCASHCYHALLPGEHVNLLIAVNTPDITAKHTVNENKDKTRASVLVIEIRGPFSSSSTLANQTMYHNINASDGISIDIPALAIRFRPSKSQHVIMNVVIAA